MIGCGLLLLTSYSLRGRADGGQEAGGALAAARTLLPVLEPAGPRAVLHTHGTQQPSLACRRPAPRTGQALPGGPLQQYGSLLRMLPSAAALTGCAGCRLPR